MRAKMMGISICAVIFLSLAACSKTDPSGMSPSLLSQVSSSIAKVTISTGAVTAVPSAKGTIQKTGEREKVDLAKAKAVLEKFLKADSLHLRIQTTYKVFDPSPVNPKTFELWLRGMDYRNDEYEGNTIKFITIIRNKEAKQYSLNTKNILTPLLPPENYTDYYKWDASKIGMGVVSSDGSYAVFTISDVDRFYKKDTAQAGYYYTKVQFGVNNQTVLYTTIFGNSSYGEKPAQVNAVTQTYQLVGINENFSDSVFNPPF